MKKFVYICLVLIIVLGSIGLYLKKRVNEEKIVNTYNSTDTELREKDIYDENVEKFTQVSATELLDSKVNMPIFLYIGRKTCPHCRKFVAQLSKVVEKFKYNIYYLDSANVSIDKKIRNIGDKFNIFSVPCLLKIYSNGESEKYAGDSEKELKDWLNVLNKIDK
ncbi:thioredoxin domain-containing protein [Enterococcus faecalis]